MPTTASGLFPSANKKKEQPMTDKPKNEVLYEQIDTSAPRDFQMGLIKDEPDQRDYVIKYLLQEENAYLDKS